MEGDNRAYIRSGLVEKVTLSLFVLLTGICRFVDFALHPLKAETTDVPKDESSLSEAYRHVEVASVSDALEQVTGKKMYMSHRMRPIFPSKFAGIALTIRLKEEANDDPTALNGMLSAIDAGQTNSVWVMVVDNGADIAGHGWPDGYSDVCAKLCRSRHTW